MTKWWVENIFPLVAKDDNSTWVVEGPKVQKINKIT